MQRILIKTNNLSDKKLIIKDDGIYNQIIKVLRAKIWYEVIFFNWEKNIDFKYKIIQINKKDIIFWFVWKIEKPIEDKKLILYQALPNKIEKIEQIIQFWTQIGFSEFIFFKSKRSQKINLSSNKLQRFEKIIKESIELSNRNIIPNINFLDKIKIKNIYWNNLFFHTDLHKAKKLKELKLDLTKNINIFIWPEWWFSEDEIIEFEKNNFVKVNLWNNILRTELAWIVVWFYFSQL